jgi:hypothetical protein
MNVDDLLFRKNQISRSCILYKDELCNLLLLLYIFGTRYNSCFDRYLLLVVVMDLKMLYLLFHVLVEVKIETGGLFASFLIIYFFHRNFVGMSDSNNQDL